MKSFFQKTTRSSKRPPANSESANSSAPKGPRPPSIAPLPPRPNNDLPSGAQSGHTASTPQGKPVKTTRTPAVDLEIQERAFDLVWQIKGLYRYLDVVSDAASGGLVDKIIIDQSGVEAFANSISPGSYSSLIRVDFNALDAFQLQPVGVYGSKDELVRFMKTLGVLDSPLDSMLLKPISSNSSHADPALRSGLYILKMDQGSKVDEPRRVYLMYWPEENTWDDDAPSSVRRNRIAFMRYLTQLTDQQLVFISDAHASTLQWHATSTEVQGEEDDDEMDTLEASDRVFNFRVAKTSEQDEDVKIRRGFEVLHDDVARHNLPGNDAPDTQGLFQPILVAGETRQAFLTARMKAAATTKLPLNSPIAPHSLRNDIEKAEVIQLGDQLSDDALAILVEHGLDKRFRAQCTDLTERQAKLHRNFAQQLHDKKQDVRVELDANKPILEKALQAEVLQRVIAIYPDELHPELVDQLGVDDQLGDIAKEYWANMLSLPFNVTDMVGRHLDDQNFGIIKTIPFKNQKRHIYAASTLLSEHPDLEQTQKKEIISIAFDGGSSTKIASVLADPKRSKWQVSSFASGVSDLLGALVGSPDKLHAALHAADRVLDPDFMGSLKATIDREPLLVEACTEAMKMWRKSIAEKTEKVVKLLANKISSAQQRFLDERINGEVRTERENAELVLRNSFVKSVNSLAENEPRSTTTYSLVERTVSSGFAHYSSGSRAWPGSIRVAGHRLEQLPPSFLYSVHFLNQSEEDKHTIRLDPLFVPRPTVNARQTLTFSIRADARIRHIQLLASDRCLLIVDEGNVSHVYLEPFATLDNAIAQTRTKKKVFHEKLGADFLVTFDESRRLLCFFSAATGDQMLHVFQIDESHTTLRSGLGSPFNLTTWFDGTRITNICFVAGGETDEICFVDDSKHARVFSMITCQCRPASLTFKGQPRHVLSSPDGSCLVGIYDGLMGAFIMEVYHWTSFGSTDGFTITIPDLEQTASGFTLTSLVDRKRVHLLALDTTGRTKCQSFALDITKKMTDFSFQAHGGPSMSDPSTAGMHNRLLDCLTEVWTRFPVVPAIQRNTITTERAKSRIAFITSRNHDKYSGHFAEIVRSFEQTTRKPTGGRLNTICISALEFTNLTESLSTWPLSSMRAGEWLVEAFCMIPIQICLAKDNAFCILQDGVSSVEWERSLLGMTVNQVAQGLSFGWYESIFSYPPLVNKPVKVVSSMGLQSTGKSYALNHLADTSFAGSAARCTEGTWMSVTPTASCLLVVLDFEGVQSIERSIQEDTLLVLFNTAFSNLVMFRNNFALGRDITNLFTSFQASTAMFDPDENPDLFQSCLVIVIKDVVENDKLEIVREFQLKFHRLVETEQAANFVTRLHRGQLTIVPWPVIESRQFYALFGDMRKRLARQPTTHASAGVFLQRLKLMMAKIKACDWGALDQNLATLRVEQLVANLHNAFTRGLAEYEPEIEPLKSLDDGVAVDHNDSDAIFYLSTQGAADNPTLRQSALDALRTSANVEDERQDMPEDEWIAAVTEHLNVLVEARLQHVGDWIAVNVARFESNAEVLKLRRVFEAAIIDLKAGLEFCLGKCAECQLSCILARRHDGLHDCKTPHACKHRCQVIEEHDEHEACGLPAGHRGSHICSPSLHLCGQQCEHVDVNGCLKACAKGIDHMDDGHICAGSHECGQACALNEVTLPDGTAHVCPGVCRSPVDLPHERHVCGTLMCPFPCALCKRLCATPDHFHALDNPGAIHLCGQEHQCSKQCAAGGVCQISNVPRAVETTFSGKHEVFQFTKYSQDARRLPCAVVIPADQLEHDGPHTHTLDSTAVHFCRMRCPNCTYLCTLPYHHAQAEHHTSHGSMVSTQWALDGDEDIVLEVAGRRYAASDNGAPSLCQVVCTELGRHAHIAYCISDDAANCNGQELEHIAKRITPHPDRPKDSITHALFWKRSGFKGMRRRFCMYLTLRSSSDPYSRDWQTVFAGCDFECSGEYSDNCRPLSSRGSSGPEHAEPAVSPAQPSYCTLPLFHAPHPPLPAPATGYVSGDGHLFPCVNPALNHQAFHVIFVIDRSGSMCQQDRVPLPGTPVTHLISRTCPDRLGAVYSALYGFWSAREAATQAGAPATAGARRDAYSLVLFNSDVEVVLAHDLTSTPRELLTRLLTKEADGGTNFDVALKSAETLLERHWSNDRFPVVIFLSDGEAELADATVYEICRKSLALGKPLALHSVSFGPEGDIAILQRMVDIATQVYSTAPRNAMRPAANGRPQCTFSRALDTIRLAETFLGIAESMRKPRASLFRPSTT